MDSSHHLGRCCSQEHDQAASVTRGLLETVQDLARLQPCRTRQTAFVTGLRATAVFFSGSHIPSALQDVNRKKNDAVVRIRAVIHAANMLNVENRKIAGNMRQLRNKAVAKAHERLARDALKHRDDEQGRRMEALKVGSRGARLGCMPSRLSDQLPPQIVMPQVQDNQQGRATDAFRMGSASSDCAIQHSHCSESDSTLCCLKTFWPSAASSLVHSSLQRISPLSQPFIINSGACYCVALVKQMP